jgi:transposase
LIGLVVTGRLAGGGEFMARRPGVFVRELSVEEGARLQRVARRSKDRVRLRRAAIVLASAAHRPAGDIAEVFAASENYVRQVIHDFNERGFAALDPKWSGGRPATIDRITRERICRIARCCPRGLGLPFSRWSLRKLADHLGDAKIAVISHVTLAKILADGGISWQQNKTWKTSKDPEFKAKMRRILDLYDHPPADGRVICVDEFGPLNLQPRPGRGWWPIAHPVRLRATYSRKQGVRHMFAALDLATGQMFYRIRDRKRWPQFLDFLKQIRTRFPVGKLYVICDNYGPHGKAEVTDWSAANGIELVFTPTNASWLNWIESEFTALRYFALDGTDHESHARQDAAIGRYIRWHNHHCKPKRHFAVSSKIRRPDYLPNVA